MMMAVLWPDLLDIAQAQANCENQFTYLKSYHNDNVRCWLEEEAKRNEIEA